MKTEQQLRQEIADAWALIDQYKAAIPALQKDAERYRWLRRRQVECAPHIAIAEKAAGRFDAAIDAAMAADGPHTDAMASPML